jgi:hypothetical protein
VVFDGVQMPELLANVNMSIPVGLWATNNFARRDYDGGLDGGPVESPLNVVATSASRLCMRIQRADLLAPLP